MIETTTRNATLPDLMHLLQQQHARKLDVVAPATAITARDGILHVKGVEQHIDLDGVTTVDGAYAPTAVADEGIADKLGVPLAYLRRLRSERPDLYDANVNGWLHGRRALVGYPKNREEAAAAGVGSGEQYEKRPAVPADPRSFLLRLFRGDEGETGIARAVLSDRYALVDNLDVLMAALDGVKAAGVAVRITGGDLTERRMSVRIEAPEVMAHAPRLLDGYRSPFTGEYGTDNPTVFAGFVLSNSETGGGAFTITPRITVQVCSNGMTITKDAMRQVHLGGKLEAGVIRWAADTEHKALELVQAKTRDAVATFLDADYLTDAVARLEERADEPVTGVDAVRDLTKPLGFSQEQIDGILGYFVQGAQMTRGGVVNAVTAYSQTVDDPDAAYDLDSKATSLLGV